MVRWPPCFLISSDQVLRRLGAQIFRQEIEIEGEDIDGLGVALDAPVGLRHTPC